MKNLNKILTILIALIFLFNIQSASAFSITGKVVTISPTEVSVEYQPPIVVGTSSTAACKNIVTELQQPTQDKYWEKLGLDTSSHPEILRYKIQWFSGGWSDWYTLGENDLDWKDNCGGKYYLGGDKWDPSRPAECSRRVWSYFTDHTHQVEICKDSTGIEPVPVISGPICDEIGSEKEGWYINGELVKAEKCACKAICRVPRIPVASTVTSDAVALQEGYYSSCTGALIEATDCSSKEPIEVSIKGKAITISQSSDEKTVDLVSEDTATTKEEIVVEEDKVQLSTATGNKEISYLPEEAKQKAIEVANLKEVTSIELVNENDLPVYAVTGKKTTNILWIIPVTTQKQVKISAQTNEAV